MSTNEDRETILELEWRDEMPYIGTHQLRWVTHDAAHAEDGTRFVRVGGGFGAPTTWEIEAAS